MKLEQLKTLGQETTLSVYTLRKLCRKGMPHYRVGRKILVDRAEFDLWFQAHFYLQNSREQGDLDDILNQALAHIGD
jgi:excisionase family DNA binding protein